VSPIFIKVQPSHFMCEETGGLLPVENSEIWVDQDGGAE
jgi:hypothetical protein